MRRLLAAMLLAGLALPAAGDDPAIKVAANTWTPLGKIAYEFPERYSGTYNLRFWCNLAWDPDGQRILFYEGYKGSHGHSYSIYANALYSLRPAERTVRLIDLSTGWKSGGGHYRYQPTTQPASPHPRHTWGALTYVPKYKRVYVGPGAAGGAPQANTFWSYDVATGAWTNVTGQPPGPSGFQTHFAHFPDSDTLWVFTPRGGSWTNLYAFDMARQTWAEKQVGRTEGFAVQHVAADARRKRALVRVNFRTPFESLFALFDPDTSVLTPVRHPAEFSTRSRMVYMPRHDRYFIHDPAGKDWTYDPAGDKFERVPAANSSTLRMDNYIVYDEANDLVVIYTIEDRFEVFRYVPPGGGAVGRTPTTSPDAEGGAAPAPGQARNG